MTIDTLVITVDDVAKLKTEFSCTRELHFIRLLKIQKQAQETLATALASQRQELMTTYQKQLRLIC